MKNVNIINFSRTLMVLLGLFLFSSKHVLGSTEYISIEENFEQGVYSWQLDEPWAITNEKAHGGDFCLSDSPNQYYDNNIEKSAQLKISLLYARYPILSFYQMYDFQNYADYGYVDISTNSGESWNTLYFVTGTSYMEWEQIRIDLSSFVPSAQNDIILRFRIKTNSAVIHDGWFIDDLIIYDNSNKISFPFFDDMEVQNDNNWSLSTWKRQFTESKSGSYCLVSGIINHSELVFNGPIDFSNANNPQLSFWYKSADSVPSLAVYISHNNGYNWFRRWGVNQINNQNWEKVQIDLSEYAKRPEILIMFKQSQDNRGLDGLYFDDILISDASDNVVLKVHSPEKNSEHHLTLNWTETTDETFVQYEIYRSQTEDVNRTNTLVATIADSSTTCYTDTLQLVGTMYYYKIYVLNDKGLYNQGSNEVFGRTSWGMTDKSFPMYDSMEKDDNFGNDSPWAICDDDAYTGTYSWSDSPNGSYDNNMDRSIYTAVNLENANRPVLSFWHKYNFEELKDFGYVEISTNEGASWSRVFFVTGFSGTKWHYEKIDLSSYYSDKEILIRFRTVTDHYHTYDGWHIDDIRIFENTTVTSYPFFDNFENENTELNWIKSTWDKSFSKCKSGNSCLMTGNINFSELVLNGRVDLSDKVNPQLSFWYRKESYGGAIIVYVSSNSGHDWKSLWSNNQIHNTEWKKVQIDLSKYSGLSIVTKIKQYGDVNGAEGVVIDDFLISDAPQNTQLTINQSGEHHLDLAWVKSEANNFIQYEIYRSTDDTVDRTSTLVTCITDASITNFTDTLPFVGTDYFYKVFILNEDLLYNQGSDSVHEKTEWGITAFSFPGIDDMENVDNWGNDAPWVISDDDSHSGAFSWTESPNDLYENNLDRSIYTYVNLETAKRPVLSFWHRYNFEEFEDFGYVEISTNQGNSWSQIFYITGFSHQNWHEEEIDLSSYVPMGELFIRFRIITNSSKKYDGWHIDDIAIHENETHVQYPLFDSFENETSKNNWIMSTWKIDDTDAFDGTHCLQTGNISASELVLKGTIDLSNAINPHLSFYHKRGENKPSVSIYVSNNLGHDWTHIWGTQVNNLEWTKVQINLTEYAGFSDIAMKFRQAGNANGEDGWYVDNIKISEPEGTISGKVIVHQNCFQFDLENGTVLLENTNDNHDVYTKITNDSGSFVFNDINEGAYQLSILYQDIDYSKTIDFSGESLSLGTIHIFDKIFGDTNHNGKVDLEDIIIDLQTIVGVE